MAKNWIIGLPPEMQEDDEDDSVQTKSYLHRPRQHSTLYLFFAAILNLIKLLIIGIESLLSWFVIYPAILFLNLYLIKSLISFSLENMSFFMWGNFLLALACIAYFSYQLLLPFLHGDHDLNPHHKAVARAHIIGYALITALIAHNKQLTPKEFMQPAVYQQMGVLWATYIAIYLTVKIFFRAAHHK